MSQFQTKLAVTMKHDETNLKSMYNQIYRLKRMSQVIGNAEIHRIDKSEDKLKFIVKSIFQTLHITALET